MEDWIKCVISHQGAETAKKHKRSVRTKTKVSTCVISRMEEKANKAKMISHHQLCYSIISTQMQQCKANFTMLAVIIKPHNVRLFFIVRRPLTLSKVIVGQKVQFLMCATQYNTKLSSALTQEPVVSSSLVLSRGCKVNGI